MTSTGLIDGEEQVIAVIHREHIGGQVRMDVNFPTLDPNHVMAYYYYEGQLLLTEKIEHGSAFGDWWDSWEVNDGGVSIGFPWGITVEITFCKTGGASTTTANGTFVPQLDRVAISPREYTGSFDGFTNWSITAAGIPSITITNEAVQLLGCSEIIPGDINEDCHVNFLDVAELANNWLECNNPDDLDCTWGL